jgi:hypothetical protein
MLPLCSLLNERDALERALHEQGPSKTRLRTLHLISKRILRAIKHQHHHEQRVYFRLAVDQIRDDPTTLRRCHGFYGCYPSS